MKEDKNKQSQASWRLAMTVFLKLSHWIVWPVLCGVLIGNWLDKKYNKDSFFLLTVIGLMFIVSMVGLSISSVREYAKIEKENKK